MKKRIRSAAKKVSRVAKRVEESHPLRVFGDLAMGIRLARTSARMSQESLARSSGITQAMLSRYESGSEVPRIQTLDQILSALHLSLADFERLARAEVREDETRKAKEESREALRSVLRALVQEGGGGLSSRELQSILKPS